MPPNPTRTHAEDKYLGVSVSDGEYAIPVVQVKEIVGMLPVTRVPNVPGHVLGVVNLRGKVIPVVDLKQKLGVRAGEPSPQPCLVVVTPTPGVQIGLVVDHVLEVGRIGAEDLDGNSGVTHPETGVVGLAKLHGRIRVLLDVATLLQEETSRAASSVANAA